MAWRHGVPEKGAKMTRHPNWVVHQLVADWIAYEWSVQSDLTADVDKEPPLPPPRHVPDTSDVFCASTDSDLDALKVSVDAGARLAMPFNGSWSFGEDVPGKKGWLIDSPRGGNVSFHVKMPREDAVVGVGYLVRPRRLPRRASRDHM